MLINITTDQEKSPRVENISRIEFIKHIAMAGMGFKPGLYKLKRMLGLFFMFSEYMKKDDFKNNRFSEPTFHKDPTAKAHFSNLVGLAIADFLSKRISNSLLTINYETVMKRLGIRISGTRPDLIAFNSNKIFAIEAKGSSSSTISGTKLEKYKIQTKNGPVPVDFSILSVAYDLYNEVKCIYEDPENEKNTNYNKQLKHASIAFYSGLREFMNEQYFEIDNNAIEINNESFIKVRITYESLDKLFSSESGLVKLALLSYTRINPISLILPQRIDDFAQEGFIDIEPFEIHMNESNTLFIDSDRVGLEGIF